MVKTIQSILYEENLCSIVSHRLSTWNGKCYKITKNSLKNIPENIIKEIQNPGVYFLIGYNKNEKDNLYIGEAEDVLYRLNQHKGESSWSEVIIFVSQGRDFNKGLIKYLESILYDSAIKLNNYKILNKNIPTKSKISYEDEITMNEVISNIILITEHLGLKIFKEIELCPIESIVEPLEVRVSPSEVPPIIEPPNIGDTVIEPPEQSFETILSDIEITRTEIWKKVLGRTRKGSYVHTKKYLSEINSKIGIYGLIYTTDIGCELYLDKDKETYDKIIQNKDKIEKTFNKENDIIWDWKISGYNNYHVKVTKSVDLKNKANIQEYSNWISETCKKFEKIFDPYFKENQSNLSNEEKFKIREYYNKLGFEIVIELGNDWLYHNSGGYCAIFKKEWKNKFPHPSNKKISAFHYEFFKNEIVFHIENKKEINILLRENLKKTKIIDLENISNKKGNIYKKKYIINTNEKEEMIKLIKETHKYFDEALNTIKL